MRYINKTGAVLIAVVILALGAEFAVQFDIPGAQSLVPSVEARVGRPLTPVSVAGVARRSVRRCAVGVYNCSMPDMQPVDILVSQIDTRPGLLQNPAIATVM